MDFPIFKFGFLFVLIFVLFLNVGSNNVEPGSETSQEWRQIALDAHNEYRRLHGADPMTMKKELCDFSQKYAFELARKGGKLKHSQKEGYGENLSKGQNSGSTPNEQVFAIANAVKPWYDEINDYDFVNGSSRTGKATDHFTQVVWIETKEVCVSYATKLERNTFSYWVVANYLPPGNFIGEFQENVKPNSEGLTVEPIKDEPGGPVLESSGTRNNFDWFLLMYYLAGSRIALMVCQV